MADSVEHRRRVPIDFPETDPHTCSPAMRLEVLGLAPLFSMLDADGPAQVDRHCRAHGYSTGDPVYHAGDVAANRLYVVATGNIKTIRSAADGHETLLDILGPGDLLGSLPALDQEHYAESAWTLTPACVLGFDAEEFASVMAVFPAVTMAALKVVSGRLSESQEAVHLLSGASLEQRLAATLLLLAAKVGVPWDGATLLQLPLSRDDLATTTGATTESMSRLMSRWHREGLIETGRQWTAIRDQSALETQRNN